MDSKNLKMTFRRYSILTSSSSLPDEMDVAEERTSGWGRGECDSGVGEIRESTDGCL